MNLKDRAIREHADQAVLLYYYRPLRRYPNVYKCAGHGDRSRTRVHHQDVNHPTPMTKHIYIGDIGTASSFTLDSQGTIEVTHTGGCPVERIIGKLDPAWSDQQLCEEIMDRWTEGYDGDPHACELHVTVEDQEGNELWSINA